MKKYVFILVILFFGTSIFFSLKAQSWEYIKTYPDLTTTGSFFGNVENISAITKDQMGNFYISGGFSGSLQLDGITLNSGNFYVAQLDSLGNVMWANSINIPVFFTNLGASDIGVDSFGNVYILGSFYVPSVNPTSSNIGNNVILAPNTIRDGIIQTFVAKFNNVGTVQWAKALSSSTDPNNSFRDLEVTSAGELLISGTYNGTLAFDNIAQLNIPSGDKSFLLKLDDNGGVIWARNVLNAIGNSVLIEELKLSKDENDIYLVGATNTATNLGFPNNNSELLLTRYDVATGTPQDTLMSQPQPNFFSNIIASVSDSGDVYISASFSNLAEFDNQIINAFSTSDAFLIKADKSGNWGFLRQLGSIGTLNITDVLWKEQGIILSGNLGSSLIIDSSNVIQTVDNSSLLLLQFNDNGDFEYYKTIGNIGNIPTLKEVRRVIDNDNETYYTLGEFNANAIFDDDTLYSSGNQDAFLGIISCIPKPISNILGDTVVCTGQYVYSLPPTNFGSGIDYQWTVDAGATFTLGDTFITVNFPTEGIYTITVAAYNDCGASTPVSLTVNVLGVPNAQVINGDPTACLGQSTYNVTNNPFYTYNWTFSGGGAIFPIGNTAIVNWAVVGNYNINVQASNICGTGPQSSFSVAVKSIPGEPSPIVGNNNICVSTQTYSVNLEPDVNYIWSLSSGGTITSNGNIATVNWATSGTHTIIVTPTNECGTGSSKTLTVNVNDVPTQPSTVVGNLQTCIGTESYSVVGNTNVNYNWSLSGGGVLTSGGSSASIIWTTAGTHTLTITPSNICGTGTPRTVTVVVENVPNQVGNFIGLDTVCIGTQNYQVPLTQGVNYTWTISGGGTIFPTGNAAVVNWTTPGTHTITVTPYNTCGTGLSRTYAVFVKNINAAFSTITGSDTVCLGIENYSVPNIGGITYDWSLNGGGTLTELNNTAFVDWSGTGIYTLNVATSDGCNSALNVEVRDNPSQPSSIFGDTIVCLGTYNYGVLSENNTNYSWSLSGGGILIENNNFATITWTASGVYTLTVTPFNDCGSGNAQTITINVQTIPQAPNSITGDTLVCLTNEIYTVPNDSSLSYQWSLSNSGAVLTTTNNQAIINWQTVDTNTITVTASNLCGTSPQTSLAVEIIDVPATPDISGDTLTCLGNEIYTIPTENYTTYNWNLSSGGILTGNNSNVTVDWNNVGLHTLTVTATNQCGSAVLTSLTVNTIDVPVQPQFIIGNDIVCQSLQAYSIPTASNTNYLWSISGGGAINALDNVANINWTTPGVHTISVTPFNECGTGTPVTKTITVRGIPAQPSAISGVTTSCLSTNVYSVVNDTTVNYTWTLNGGGILTPNGNTATINWQSTGTYIITVIPQSSCGVGSPRSLTVQVGDIPAVPQLTTGDTIVCLGSETYAISPILGETYNWSLSSGGTISTNGNTATVNWLTTGNHTITVIPSNSCGNGNPLIINVSTGTTPSAISTIVGNDNVCLGNQTYSVPAIVGNSYTWSLSGGGTLVTSINTVNINWTTAGIHTITVTPSNNCGNGNTVTKTVIVKDIPNQPSVITGVTNACLSSYNYSIINDTSLTYVWSVNGGGIITQNGNTATVNWQNTGTYILSVIPQNACGTGTPQTLTVQVGDVPNLPQLNTGDTVVCLGNELYEISQISGVSYNWSLSSGGTINTVGNTATINWTTTGIHTITVIPSNACGNGNSLNISVTVNSIPSQISAINGNTSVCLGTEVYTIPSVIGESYNWSLSSGGLLSANGNTATVIWQTKGNHTLSVVPANSCGVAPLTSLVINVNDVPDQPFSVTGDNSVCENSVEIYSTTSIANTSYNWSLNGGGTLSFVNNVATVDWNAGGFYTLSVVPSNNCGTGAARTINVEVRANDLSTSEITGDVLVCNGEEVFYTADFNPDLDYDWFISGNGSLTQVSNSAVVQWQEAGDATIGLIPSSDCGVGDTAFINVTIQDPLPIPTITQSGDSLIASTSEGLKWYLDNEVTPITTDYLIPQLEGIYTITAENICGATGFSQPFIIGGATSGLFLYPNPASRQVTLRFPVYLRWYYYEIYDFGGRVVKEAQFYNGTQEDEINIRELQSGVYYMRIYTELGYFNKKLVVQN